MKIPKILVSTITIFLIATLALSTVPVLADWPFMRHDLINTGATPGHGPQASVIAWQTNLTKYLGSAVNIRSFLAIDAGKVIAATHLGNVVCLDETSGKVLWNVTPSAFYQTGGFIDSAKGLVITADMGHNVFALNLTNGATVWTINPDPLSSDWFVAPPQVDPAFSGGTGLVLAGEFNPGGDVTGQFLWAINETTGAVVWSFNATTGYGITGTAAVRNGRVFIGTTGLSWGLLAGVGGTFYCLDEATGANIWNVTCNGNLGGAPSVAVGKVFIGTGGATTGNTGGYAMALNETDGAVVWNVSIAYWAAKKVGITQGPAVDVAGGYVVFEAEAPGGASGGTLAKLNMTDGATIWSTTFGSFAAGQGDGGNTPYIPAAAPAIITSSGHKLIYISGVDNPYVANGHEKVFCFNTDTGALVWSYLQPGGNIVPAKAAGSPYSLSSPTIAGSNPAYHVFVGSWNGLATCFGEPWGWPYLKKDLCNTGATYDIGPRSNQTSWQTNLTSYAGTTIAMRSILTVAGGKVIAQSGGTHPLLGAMQGYLTCIDEDTGKVIWQTWLVQDYITGATIDLVKGLVICADNLGHNIYALNLTNGSLKWSVNPGALIGLWFVSPPQVDPVALGGSGLVITGDFSPFAVSKRLIWALNETDGTVVWNFTTPNNVWGFTGTPAIHDGRVFLGNSYQLGAGGCFYCLDETTGAQIWNRTGNAVVGGQPAVAAGKVFIGTGGSTGANIGGRAMALNETDGTLLWNVSIAYNSTYKMGITQGPAVDVEGGYVVFEAEAPLGASGGTLAKLNMTDGSTIWSFTFNSFPAGQGDGGNTPYTPSSPPAITTLEGQKLIYITGVDNPYVSGGGHAKVFCFNADTGALVWSYLQPGGNIVPIPASNAAYSECGVSIADSHVFVGSWNGLATCFGEDWSEWPNWRNNPSLAAYSISGPLTNETLWKKTVIGTGFAPVAKWGMIFSCIGTNSCSAFNETTGAKIWESYASPNGIQGAPAAGTDAVNGTKLVVCAETYGAYVLAYNASNTNPINYPVWNVTPGIAWVLGSPIVYNGVAYIETFQIYGNGQLVAINLTNGANVWKTPLPTVGGRPMWGGPLSPCINPDAGLVYAEMFGKTAGVNNYTTAMTAMNISTGSIVWTTLLNDHNVSTHTSPVYTKNLGVNGSVYAGDGGGYVYCLDPITGAIMWTGYYGNSYLTSGEARGISPLALDDAKNMLVFTSGNHTLWNVKALSGAVNWAKPCNSSIPGGPVIGGNNTVYVATAGTFTAATNETLRCYNETSGASIWNYTFSSLNTPNLCSPILAHEHLFWISSNYTATDYTLICIGSSSGPPPFPPFWTKTYWYSAGYDSINVAKFQSWRDIKNMSIAVNFAGPANLTAILSMNIISEAGGEIRLNISSTVPGYVNGTKKTVSVLGTLYGTWYYDTILVNYTEFVAAGWYNVTFQWRSLGALSTNWMMNDPTGSPGYMHRSMHVAAQNPNYATTLVGTTDINVAKYQNWQLVSQMSLTVNLLSDHNVTVAYSIRVVSSAAVQPSGEIRLVINGTGVGWVNGSRRVDSIYRQIGDYDCALGNWTGSLPAGNYVVRMEWRALGISTDYIINQPILWPDLMHREMHVIVNPP